jgi:hypothetical protein
MAENFNLLKIIPRLKWRRRKAAIINKKWLVRSAFIINVWIACILQVPQQQQLKTPPGRLFDDWSDVLSVYTSFDERPLTSRRGEGR